MYRKRASCRKFHTKDEYTVSCQPAIWEKEFWKKCIGSENYNAWVFEGIYVNSMEAHKQYFLDKLRIDYRNLLQLHHGAVQGKLLPSTVRYFRNRGYILKSPRHELKGKQYAGYIIKRIILFLLPCSFKKLIKKKFYANSVIEKHSEEINKMMDKMHIH